MKQQKVVSGTQISECLIIVFFHPYRSVHRHLENEVSDLHYHRQNNQQMQE